MVIKKFQGKTKEDALLAARKELGDNIIVLTERDAKPKWYQLFQKKKVELTVAKEEEAEIAAAKQHSNIAEAVAEINMLRSNMQKEEPPVAASAPAAAKEPAAPARSAVIQEESVLNEKLDTIQNLLQEKWKQDQQSQTRTGSAEPVREAEPVRQSGSAPAMDAKQEEALSEMNDFLKLLKDTMTENEIRSEIADEMIEEVRKNLRGDMDMEYILSQIYQKMILKFGKAECITPSKRLGPKLLYFIGPTGVGKTTTLAKIASQLSLAKHKKIALFTADTYRISATDQSKTYANIMNVPFHIIYSVDEMKSKFDGYRDYDYILVDTAGHSHLNEQQLKAMNEFVHAFDEVADKEVYLVLSATTKYRDLISIADTYKGMTEYKIIFTKLDETATCGNLLNLRIHTDAPLSYVTCGQNVPEDISRFDPQETVKKLLSLRE